MFFWSSLAFSMIQRMLAIWSLVALPFLKPAWTHGCPCLLSLLSHVRLFATLWIVVHQGPLSIGILQTRIPEWFAMPSSKGSSQPRDWTCVSCGSCIAGRFFTAEPRGKTMVARTYCCILNGWPIRTYCIAHRTLLNVMCQHGWEGSLGENGYMYMYGWVPLLFAWNYCNVVNLLNSYTK